MTLGERNGGFFEETAGSDHHGFPLDFGDDTDQDGSCDSSDSCP